MANNIITNQIIADESIAMSENENAFLQNINRQYDKEYARTGAKAGDTIRIRLPVEYTRRLGPTAVPQDTKEANLTMTVGTQAGVDMSFSTAQRTLAVDEFRNRYIRPAMNTVVGGMATDVMLDSEGGASGWAAAYDGSGNLLAPVQNTWLAAKAVLSNSAVPSQERKVVAAPDTIANTVASLSGLFNKQEAIGRQYETGTMYKALGFDWMEEVTVLGHTTGTLASSPAWVAGKGWSFGAVNGAAQGQAAAVSSLTVTALTGTLKKGDIIAIDGVFAVNPVNKLSTGKLRTFAVTADVASGATSIPIYPALLGIDGSGNAQQYQTVTAAPANSAVIYSMAKANSVYRKNLAMNPNAVTLAVVDLVTPSGQNADVSRRSMDSMSIRVLTQYQGTSDQDLTRLDVLYGWKWLKPEWCVIVPDPIS